MIELYEQLGHVRDENESLKRDIKAMKKLFVLSISILFIFLILVRLSK